MIDTQITPSYIFGVFLAYALFSILIFIPSTVIYWKLFKKAGHEGWRYIIPVDGQYTMGLIAGSPKLGLATGIIWAVYYIQALARTFYIGIPQSVVFTVGILWIVTSLVLLGKFIQKFDAGIGRWIVFVFFGVMGAVCVWTSMRLTMRFVLRQLEAEKSASSGRTMCRNEHRATDN